MKATRRAFLLVGAFALALGPSASAQGRSIALRNYDALLTVHSDGSLDVTEQITFHFTGAWNGINRDLSLKHNTALGRATKLDVTVGYITDENGERLRVEESNKDRGWTHTLKIYIPGAYDADRTIIIRYRVANAIRFFFAKRNQPAFDELYWNVTGNSWDMPIDSAHARVVLPEGVAATRTAVYTGAAGSKATDADIKANGNEIDFTLRRPLGYHEGMTVAAGWPAGHISSRPSEAHERWLETLQWAPLLIPLVVFLLTFNAWRAHGRDPEEGAYVVRYEPIKGASPAELGTLVDNKADIEDITATLVDLAVRGFLKIEEITESHLFGLSKSTDYIIHIIKSRSDWSVLKKHEECYLSTLSNTATDGQSVKISELRDKFYTSLPTIRNGIYDSLVASGYYLERPDKVRTKWAGFGILSVVLGGVVSVLALKFMWVTISPTAIPIAAALSAITFFVFAPIMPARTIEGARAREATLGFKEFLERVEEQRYKAMITSPEMFERFLPYAMAFGVADKWAKAFQDMYREPPTWYVGGTGQFNAVNFSHSINTMSSAAASSMSSSPSASGSGGGGSSGGGSGGGGGSGF